MKDIDDMAELIREKEKELLEESKRTLEAERGEVLKVRQEVHGGKSNLISKLKSKIKELESEFEIKVLEIEFDPLF